MASVGSSYTFQSSGTVAGNAQNSVVMAPSSNGSILLQQKQDGTTVYTRFLKVTSLILTANNETRTLSWTDVNAASYDLKVQENGTLVDTITIDDTSQVVSGPPFGERSYTVTCTVNGETLPDSNEVTLPAIDPEVIFQTSQVFQILGVGTPVSAGSYLLTELLDQINTNLQKFNFLTFDGTYVTLNPGGTGVTIPDGEYTAQTLLILSHLGFSIFSENPQIPINELITNSIQASISIQLTQGGTPTAPTKPTNLAVSDITPTSATLTVDITNYEDVKLVQVVVQNGIYWTGGIGGVVNPSSNQVSISVSDLTPNTEYTYAIQTTTIYDLSPVSDPVTFTTSMDSTPPPVPTDLVLTQTQVRTPTLQWQQSGEQPSSFTINIQNQSDELITTLDTGIGIPLFDFPADTLTLGTTQKLGVAVGSNESDHLTVTISTTLSPPTLTVESVSTNSLYLVFTDVNDHSGAGVTQFDLTVNSDPPITDLESPYTLTGLTPGTSQTLTVVAKFTSGGPQTTPSSSPVTGTTSVTTQVDAQWVPIQTGIVPTTGQISMNYNFQEINFVSDIIAFQGTLISSAVVPEPIEYPASLFAYNGVIPGKVLTVISPDNSKQWKFTVGGTTTSGIPVDTDFELNNLVFVSGPELTIANFLSDYGQYRFIIADL